MKLPKPFPFLGLQVLEVHKQLGTWSSYITLVEVSLRNNEISCEDKEDNVHLSFINLVLIIGWLSLSARKYWFCVLLFFCHLGWGIVSEIHYLSIWNILLQNCTMVPYGSEIEYALKAWVNTHPSESTLNWYPSMVSFPGRKMVQLRTFLKKLFRSRLFTVVKILLKYNRKLFPVNVMLDKNPEKLYLFKRHVGFWFGLRFELGFFEIWLVGGLVGYYRKKIENTWKLNSCFVHIMTSIRGIVSATLHWTEVFDLGQSAGWDDWYWW